MNAFHPSRFPDSNISVTCMLLANHPERANRHLHIPPQHYTAKENHPPYSSTRKHFPAKVLQAQRLLPGQCSPSPVLSHAPPLAACMSLTLLSSPPPPPPSSLGRDLGMEDELIMHTLISICGELRCRVLHHFCVGI